MPRPFLQPFAGLLVIAALLLAGCSNPYLKGFTGDAGTPLAEDAPVRVVGANRADAGQMRAFESAHADATARHTLLGTSTIVSGNSLRDSVAAKAARALGANLVLYSFAYIDSTVETDRTNNHDTYDHDNHRSHGRSYSYTSTTRHWYEYRAFFYRASE